MTAGEKILAAITLGGVIFLMVHALGNKSGE